MNTHSIMLTSLVKAARTGKADAGEALGYVLTGIISAALPELGLGYHQYEERGDYRRMRWCNLLNEETVRVALVGGDQIAFRLYDHDTDRWGGTTFPNIRTMIRELRRVADATDTDSCMHASCGQSHKADR